MLNKRTIDVIYTNHAKERMNQRNFTEEGVQIIVEYGEEEILPDGCKRYTLTDNIPPELLDTPEVSYFRGKKVILSPDNVVKTVINNDVDSPDFETYRNYLVT